MLNSTVLDVAVGLSLVYFLMSALCSTARELIARVLHEREQGLVDGIHRLLGAKGPRSATVPLLPTPSSLAGVEASIVQNGADLAARTLAHPLIHGMATTAGKAPAYLPAHSFAVALIDVLSPASKTVTTIAGLRAAVTKIDDPFVHSVLLPLLDTAGTDLTLVRATIERRFDDVMDRVSGWYKRRTQMWVFLAALVAAGAGNVDSITIASTLYREPTVRAHVIALASTTSRPAPAYDPAATPAGAAESIDAYKTSSEMLKALDLPVGWANEHDKLAPWWLARKVLGLLLTVLAVMLGAPFWFDVLSKIANVRSTGPRPVGATPAGSTSPDAADAPKESIR